MQPYEITLAVQHDRGFHEGEEHPSCPVCERHRIACTRTIDVTAMESITSDLFSASGEVEAWAPSGGPLDLLNALEAMRAKLADVKSELADARATVDEILTTVHDDHPELVESVETAQLSIVGAQDSLDGVETHADEVETEARPLCDVADNADGVIKTLTTAVEAFGEYS